MRPISIGLELTVVLVPERLAPEEPHVPTEPVREVRPESEDKQPIRRETPEAPE